MTFFETYKAVGRKIFGTIINLILICLCGLWLWKVIDNIIHGSESGFYRGVYYHIVWREHPFLSAGHWLPWVGIPLIFGLGFCIGIFLIWLPESKTNTQRNPRISQSWEATTDNYGQPWSFSEDAILIEQFAQRMAIKDIADKHKRSTRAIRMRLEKLGKLAPPPPDSDNNN